MKKYKYKTDIVACKEMSKIYPFDGLIYIEVLFHTLDGSDSISYYDSVLDNYYASRDYGDDYDDDDEDEYSGVFTDDDNDYNDKDDLLIKREYMGAVAHSLCSENGCTTAFATCYNNDKSDNINDAAVIGFRIYNSIDIAVYKRYSDIISNNDEFEDTYEDIRKFNDAITTVGINDGIIMYKDIMKFLITVIQKYLSVYKYHDIPLDSDRIDIHVDNVASPISIEIDYDKESFFSLNRFMYKIDLSNYKIDNVTLNAILDHIYLSTLRFGNYVNVYYPTKDILINSYKYDNGKRTCKILKNDVGSTYLFLDGYKF